jgi:hypothetical protein
MCERTASAKKMARRMRMRRRVAPVKGGSASVVGVERGMDSF